MSMLQAAQHPCCSITMVEITVLSAEGLNHYTSFLTPIRPFITLTKLPATATAPDSDKSKHVVAFDGGGDDAKFRVPVDPSFFSDRCSCLHLQLFNKRRIVGPAQLGWCLIPASDIGFLPSGSVRYLSYRLRARDGSRGHAIINISVRLEGYVPWMSTSISPTLDACQTVIGIPVTAVRGVGNGDCSSSGTTTTTISTNANVDR